MTKIPFLSYYPEINQYASDFLKTYNSERIFPLLLEEIIELKLKIKIFPLKNLYASSGIEGFISSDGKTITIDDNLYQQPKLANRYRSTLAHEIGHLFIHSNILSQFEFDDPEAFFAYRDSFTQKEKDAYEFHAHAFAGLILIPQNLLILDLKKHLVELKESSPLLRKGYVAERLAGTYSVSTGMVFSRIKFEKKFNKYLQKLLGVSIYKLLAEMDNE